MRPDAWSELPVDHAAIGLKLRRQAERGSHCVCHTHLWSMQSCGRSCFDTLPWLVLKHPCKTQGHGDVHSFIVTLGQLSSSGCKSVKYSAAMS